MTPAGDGYKSDIAVLAERVSAVRKSRAIFVGLAMTPKLQALSSKLRDVTQQIEARAEKLSSRLDVADGKSADADARAHAELDKIEQAVRSVEDLVNQMSNGGPPLEGSNDSSKL